MGNEIQRCIRRIVCEEAHKMDDKFTRTGEDTRRNLRE